MTVNARECSEAEFEASAKLAALSVDIGLRYDRVECSDLCLEMVGLRGWTSHTVG